VKQGYLHCLITVTWLQKGSNFQRLLLAPLDNPPLVLGKKPTLLPFFNQYRLHLVQGHPTGTKLLQLVLN